MGSYIETKTQATQIHIKRCFLYIQWICQPFGASLYIPPSFWRFRLSGRSVSWQLLLDSSCSPKKTPPGEAATQEAIVFLYLRSRRCLRWDEFVEAVLLPFLAFLTCTESS